MRNREAAAAKARELVGKMTVEEKASQLKYDAPAIPRLGIPAYNWWNEVLHGVARAGTATVFPQAIGLAAMFDEDMQEEIASVISHEARAKYNGQSSHGDRDIYKGLTVWSPNINIFRDPRWGRGHETYGEDPYLTSRLGIRFIKGLQGDGKYLKVAACSKHFAVHSGPEAVRHEFDAIASPKDMTETYLAAFEATVKEAEVESVMGAYNRVNGEPACGSETLLKKTLREKWGFKGHVVSDCWAVRDFHENHKVTDTAPESAAMAIRNGCDLNCGNTYLHLLEALHEGLVSEDEITTACERVFTTRFLLGLFDNDCEYDRIPVTDTDTDENAALALRAAEKSMVLLENNGILPLDPEKIKTVAVIGPNADSIPALEGNYNGTSSRYVTFLEGIRTYCREHGIRVLYSLGCHLFKDRTSNLAMADDRLAEAEMYSEQADVTIACVGLDAGLEGEEGDTGNEYFSGDSGHLPLTFYRSVEDLPAFEDYSMKNRTYRYFSGDVLYPFGYGLSYTKWEIARAEKAGNTIIADVSNKGKMSGDAVIQVYVRCESPDAPLHPRLCGFARISIPAGETRTVSVPLDKLTDTVVNEQGERIKAETAVFFVGMSQPDEKSVSLCGVKPAEIR